jgi:hypothetical protein
MIELDSTNPQHKELARLALAKNDIQAARTGAIYVSEKITHPNDPLFTPMSCAMAVCYSRPFIIRRNHVSLPQRYSRFLSAKLRSAHNYLIEHRNSFEAHRDEELNTVSLIPAGTEFAWEGGSGVLASHGEYISSRFLNLDSFPIFISLFDFQIERIREKLQEQKDQLFPANKH